MNSRERVIAALNHDEPDRVPMDLGGGVSSLTLGAYQRLTAYMGIDRPEGVVGEFKVMQKIDEQILERLDVDFRHVFMRPPKGWQPRVHSDGTFEDEWGIRFRDVGHYTEMVGHPLADASVEDLERYAWPDFSDPTRVEGLREEARYLYENTGYALATGSVGGRILEQSQWLRGIGQFLVDLVANQDFAEALLDKMVELQKQFFEAYLGAVGEYVEVVVMGDDLGTQDRLMMSPQTYRKMIKPRHYELYSWVKKRTKAKIFHHSCGAIYPLIGDLIEVGVDILNPVQPRAAGMDPERLKREFGDKLCFWGGVDEQRVLPFGSEKDVAEEVARRIAALAPGGGYVVSPAHNVQPDVSPENLCRLYSTVLEVGRYPVRSG